MQNDETKQFHRESVKQVNGIKALSFGVSSFGYDLQVADEFRILKKGVDPIDPKRPQEDQWETLPVQEDETGRYVIIPPHSFVLGRSVEYWRIPEDIITVAVAKSSYARVGIIPNVTPFEPCYSDDTECLTYDGWKLIKDVQIGEKIATLSPDGTLEYKPVERKQAYFYEGDMIHFKGKSIDLLVTPDHMVYAKNRYQDSFVRIKAEDIYKRHNWEMKRNAIWQGEEPEPTIQVAGECVPIKDWLTFLGYYLGDGYASYTEEKRNYLVQLCCFKERKVSKYGELVNRLPFNFFRSDKGFSVLNKRLYEELKSFGGHSDKFIPRWILNLSRPYLEILLDALIESDGNRETMTFTTTSRQLADDVQELALKVGKAAIVRELSPEKQNGQAPPTAIQAKKPCFKVRIVDKHLTPKVRPETHHKVFYRGMVYDVTIPNHVLYVRRNGKPVWSGNCWEGIVTLEITNSTDRNAKVYAGEGLVQVLFFRGEKPARTYVDKGGRYQGQTGITLSRWWL